MAEIQNQVESSNKDRIKRFEKGESVIQRIYDSLPECEKSSFLQYREQWQATDVGRLDQSFPLNVYLDITTSCNLKCTFCTRGYAEQWKKVAPVAFENRQMGFENFKIIVDECADNGLQGLWFGGGETFLEKDVEEMVSYAREKKISDVAIVTNGLLLDKERIRKLIDIPVTRLSISVDAFTAETYKKLRGGDYSKVKNNIDTLISMRQQLGVKLPIIRLTFLEHPDNVQERDDFIAYWKDRVDVVDIQKLQQFDQNKIVEQKERTIKCTFPWRSVMIMSNGDVMPCCSLIVTAENTMGNIYELPLKEIWDSKRFRIFRENMKNGIYSETCKMCYDSMDAVR